MFELIVVVVLAVIGRGAGDVWPDDVATGPQEAIPQEAIPQQAAPETQQATPAPEATGAREPEPQLPTGQFTTAVEVRPILEMTQGQWIALRDYDGKDLLYFTQLLSWRCGLWDIRYGINGASATEVLPMEPCHEGTASPNALTSVDYPIYLEFAAGSVESVTVAITYDDGTSAEVAFQRAQVLMP